MSTTDGADWSVVSEEAGSGGPLLRETMEVEEEPPSMATPIQMEMAKTMETLRAYKTQR